MSDSENPLGKLEDTGAVPEHGGAEGAITLQDALEKAWPDDEPDGGSEAAPTDGTQETGPDTGGAEPGKSQDAPQAGTQPEGGATAPQDSGTSPTQPVEAPANWPAADREMFAKQTPEAREWLMRRHREMEGAFTRNSQAIAPMRQLTERWDPYFRQLGVPAPQAIDRLLDTEYNLRNGSNAAKIEILQRLVQDYGIAPPDTDDEGNVLGPDPQVAELTRQIEEMRNGQMQQHQAVQHRRVAHAAGAIQTFAEQKGADGTLAHPFFGEVKSEMTRLAQADLAAGVQPDLKSLYDRAAWANPTVRARMLAADNQEKTQKAKRAAVQVSGAGAPAAEQPKGLREALEAGWDNLAAA